MAIEEKSTQASSRDIELADNFKIIQPYKRKSPLRWILPLCILIIIPAVIWLFYSKSQPIIRILPNSEEEIYRKALVGIPLFIDNENLCFSENNDEKNSVFVFCPISPSGKLINLGMNDKTGLSEPAILNISEKMQLFAFTLTKYKSPRIYVTSSDMNIKLLGYGDSPSFANDRKTIVFHKINKGINEIWAINNDDLSMKSLNLNGRRPECSPKSGEIIFESSASGKRWNIWKSKLSNTKGSLKPLTDGRANCLYPSFSPDGSLILFYKEGDGLWMMNKNGSKQKRLLPVKNNEVLTGRISPDGKNLAVWSGNPKKNGRILIYKIKYEGKKISKSKVDIDSIAKLIKSINNSDESD